MAEPKPVKEKPKVKKYKIKRGDTLIKIGKKHKTSWKRIWYANKKIKHQDNLKVGQVIVLPDDDQKLKVRKLVEARRGVVLNAVGNVSGAAIKDDQTGPFTPSQGLNGYEAGQCTAFVASKRYVPAGWGDASSWKQSAINAGWTVSSRPVAGAIAWRWGHVAYVESVGGNKVLISEQNYDWNSGIRSIWIDSSSYEYLY